MVIICFVSSTSLTILNFIICFFGLSWFPPELINPILAFNQREFLNWFMSSNLSWYINGFLFLFLQTMGFSFFRLLNNGKEILNLQLLKINVDILFLLLLHYKIDWCFDIFLLLIIHFFILYKMKWTFKVEPKWFYLEPIN